MNIEIKTIPNEIEPKRREGEEILLNYRMLSVLERGDE